MGFTPREWRLMLAGLLAMTAAFGTARFIYTPLLPLMQESIADFGPSRAGGLAAVNFLGYLLSAMAMMLVIDWRLKRRLFMGCLLAASLTTLGMGLTTDDLLWQAMRFISGAASAGAIILGAALLMKSIEPARSSLATGIYLSGVGAGIVFSGLLTELLKQRLDWSELWIAAGGVSLLLCLPVLLGGVIPRQAPAAVASHQAYRGRSLPLLVGLIFLAYFCAGLGYVVSATFLVAVLKAEASLRAYGDLVWVLVGLAAAPSGLLWATLARRWSVFGALILAFCCQALGVAMPVLSDSLPAAVLGALLFGGTFLGIVSMVLAYSGHLSAHHPTRLVGLMTAAFGLGQILGPWGAGWIAERQGSYDGPLIAAAAVSLLGGLFIAASALTVRLSPLQVVRIDAPPELFEESLGNNDGV